MTDISKEAVEETCKALEYPEFALRPTLTNGRKGADMLRALLARVEEMEAARIRLLNQKLSGEWRDEIFDEGFLQGLDEAAAKLKERIEGGKTCVGLDAIGQLEGAADDIEALKDQSHD